MRLIWVNAVLLGLVALSIGAVEVWDRPETAVETSVRRYSLAIANGDLDGAMAEIAPSERPRWRDWVEWQLGNVYTVTGVAVRAPWLLARPVEVTADLDVNRGSPGEFYQASPRVSVEEVDGRWYLAAPLLASPAELEPQGGSAEPKVIT